MYTFPLPKRVLKGESQKKKCAEVLLMMKVSSVTVDTYASSRCSTWMGAEENVFTHAHMLPVN